MDLIRHAEAVLMRALANGGAFAEIYFEETSATSIRFEDSKIERINSGTDIGAGIRVLTGDRTCYAHTNDVSIEGLLAAADTVAGAVSEPRKAYSFDYRPEHFGLSVAKPAQAISTREKADLLAEAGRAARAHDARMVQVAATYADALRHTIIANSEGRFVELVRSQIMLMVHAVAACNGIIQTGYHAVGGTTGFELFDANPPETVALKAARQACLMLDASPAPAGRMPVVIAGEAGGTMIHEAVGHGLEADHIEKNMSKYCGRLGETIAVPEITVIDDASLPGLRGSYPVDSEGTPGQRTILIENGRLVRFMNDLRTARKLGMPPTGNGRRESFQEKPIPRMTNTFIAPGKANLADVLASTPQGLYVRKMGGGQVNPLNGDFVFEVSEGYLIRNGAIAEPIRGASLIGNGPDVLLNIDAVCDDVGFVVGTCGKDGQGAPVTSGQPTIRIRELTVGGTA